VVIYKFEILKFISLYQMNELNASLSLFKIQQAEVLKIGADWSLECTKTIQNSWDGMLRSIWFTVFFCFNNNVLIFQKSTLIYSNSATQSTHFFIRRSSFHLIIIHPKNSLPPSKHSLHSKGFDYFIDFSICY